MQPENKIKSSRVEVADALRGIAIIGIILIHALQSFDAYHPDARLSLPCDDLVHSIGVLLLSDKMYGIFALLFGFSFHIMSVHHSHTSHNFPIRFAWRMILLFVIGLANIAIYDGDILTTYSICGLIIIPLGYLSNKWLWVTTCLLLAQPLDLWLLISQNELETNWMWNTYAMLCQCHQQGSFWQNMAMNLQYAFPANLYYFLWSGRLTQILGLFVLGILLGRYRSFNNEGINLKKWRIILLTSLPIAITGSIADIGCFPHWLGPMVNLAILLSEVSIVVLLWYSSERIRRLCRPVCCMGQMSLSNYLLQTLLGCLLFYGYGFALYHETGYTVALLVGMTIAIIQMILSNLWKRHHTRGPIENLWRILTWNFFKSPSNGRNSAE